MIIYAVIDAFKECDLALVDTPGAYLSVDMDNNLFMISWVKMKEFMVAEDPALYRKYISYGRRR